MVIHLSFLHFNPLPPHGGRRIFVVVHQPCYYFNPLPPHGGRRIVLFWIAVLWHFNPLPPHGGRRIFVVVHQPCYYFNPLPPHGGRRIVLFWIAVLWHFNPLPPHGGRPVPENDLVSVVKFQSTPSTRRETRIFIQHLFGFFISIHSLHTEGDRIQFPAL